jgi:hypothetical protein
MKPQYEKNKLDFLGVEYIGQQERLNDYSLDMFTDLKTGSSFIRLPTESIAAARDRIRAGVRLLLRPIK